MRKRLLNLITIVLLVVMIGLSVLTAVNFTTLTQQIQTIDREEPPYYRYMVILDGSDANFVAQMENGLNKASEDYSVVYELWAFKGETKEDSILRQLDIGIESRVDGIVVQAFEDQRFTELFLKATRNSVPVITIDDDVPSQEKVSFVTYNKYQMGSRIGRLLNNILSQSGTDEGTIAIIQNSPLFNQDQAFAIQEELNDTYKVQPVNADSESERFLNAEGLAKAIISEYDDLAAFICLSSEETSGVVSALKEANMIDDVIIIGSGDTEEILDYINRGVVEATIVLDIENVGYEALFDLTKYNNGQFVTQYRDIDVDIVDKSNMKTYLEEVGDGDV